MIREVICERCGIAFKTPYKEQRFCSHSCANRGAKYVPKSTEEHFDDTLEWNTYYGRWECPYQNGVGCHIRSCDKCGWNPVVAKARLDAYMEKHNEG